MIIYDMPTKNHQVNHHLIWLVVSKSCVFFFFSHVVPSEKREDDLHCRAVAIWCSQPGASGIPGTSDLVMSDAASVFPKKQRMWMAHFYGMCPIWWQSIWSISEPIPRGSMVLEYWHLITLGLFKITLGVNVGKYSIHGSLGILDPYAIFFKIIYIYTKVYTGDPARVTRACEDFSDEPWWALSHVAGRDPDRWKSEVPPSTNTLW